jgi:hypothetical protein
MSPALTDVAFDASRLRAVELYDLTARLETLEEDSPQADQAVSLLYLANECVETAAAICNGGPLLSEDVLTLMMVTGYRITGIGGDDSVSLREARAAVRAVYGESQHAG